MIATLTESEDGVACPGCTWCSRLYCIDCRNRTGNVFSAAVGSRTFKRAECLRHADRWHRKERGSHSVPTLLTKEAEKVKQNRVRTIFAVLFLAVEKIALHSSKSGLLLLKTAGIKSAAYPTRQLSLRLSVVDRKQPATGGQEAAGGERERKMRRRSGSLSGQILGL